MLLARTRLFHLQADKGHFFPFLPPIFALYVLELSFSLFRYLLTLKTLLSPLTHSQAPKGSSLSHPAQGNRQMSLQAQMSG